MSSTSTDCFDLECLEKVHVNLTAVKNIVTNLKSSRQLEGNHRVAWLLKAITLIDLTTLAGDDTPGNVTRLCHKAAHPINEHLLKTTDFISDADPIHIRTAAVCVYPSKVEYAVNALKKLKMEDKIRVASVATGFPSGQMPLATRLEEIRFAVAKGAKEIDIVIDRSLVFQGKWSELHDELKQMRKACGDAHMKAILATGELESLNNVYKASLVAMMAGADFIKTSTGKEAINATLAYGIVMAWAIKDFEANFGRKVGLKPAGGIRTSQDALEWLIMVKEVLGNAWLTPQLFRFGASGLLTDIEMNLCKLLTGKCADISDFTMG